MGKKLRIALFFAGLLLFGAVATVIGLYVAAQRVPEFYQRAIAVDSVRARQGSQQMTQRASTLAKEVRREGQWDAIFSADQVNGWLAVDLAKNYSDKLPPEFADPRISIEPGKAIVACRYTGNGISTVLSLETEISLSGPNVIALRLRKAAAGAVPVPLTEVLSGIKQAAAQSGTPLEWRQVDGDPVALITLPPLEGRRRAALQVEKLELRSGEIYVSGRTTILR